MLPETYFTSPYVKPNNSTDSMNDVTTYSESFSYPKTATFKDAMFALISSDAFPVLKSAPLLPLCLSKGKVTYQGKTPLKADEFLYFYYGRYFFGDRNTEDHDFDIPTHHGDILIKTTSIVKEIPESNNGNLIWKWVSFEDHVVPALFVRENTTLLPGTELKLRLEESNTVSLKKEEPPQKPEKPEKEEKEEKKEETEKKKSEPGRKTYICGRKLGKTFGNFEFFNDIECTSSTRKWDVISTGSLIKSDNETLFGVLAIAATTTSKYFVVAGQVEGQRIIVDELVKFSLNSITVVPKEPLLKYSFTLQGKELTVEEAQNNLNSAWKEKKKKKTEESTPRKPRKMEKTKNSEEKKDKKKKKTPTTEEHTPSSFGFTSLEVEQSWADAMEKSKKATDRWKFLAEIHSGIIDEDLPQLPGFIRDYFFKVVLHVGTYYLGGTFPKETVTKVYSGTSAKFTSPIKQDVKNKEEVPDSPGDTPLFHKKSKYHNGKQ
jgi:hypothetical protein